MRTWALLFIAVLQAGALSQKLQYPATRTADVVDDYHGTRVADPYRWMEDPNSTELAGWIAEQNQLTETYLGGLEIR